MDAEITYRLMRRGEETAVYALVERCFNTFVAPEYSTEGVHAFLYYAHPERLAERQQDGHFVLVACAGQTLAGMIEMRGNHHVSLLFVDEAFHRRGIGRELLRRALAMCRERLPELNKVSVNSSPYAVPVYERLGFHADGPAQEKNGIRFIPMVYHVEGGLQ